MRFSLEKLEPRRLLTGSAELPLLALEYHRGGSIGEAEFLEFVRLNEDEFPDLIVGSGDDALTLLLGDGKGGFQEVAEITSIGPATAVDFGDLNGDGTTDFVVSGPARISTVLSHDNTWTVAEQMDVVANSVSLHDFDGDRNLDLLTRASCSSLTVRFGLGTGRFTDVTSYPADSFSDPRPICDVLEGDFDLDGDVDIVRALNDATEVLLNDGTGTFEDHIRLLDVPAPFAVFDANGDDHLDLITVARTIHLGKADGSFTAAVDQIGDETLSLDTSFSVSDFNQDGAVDLLIYEAFFQDHFGLTVPRDLGTNIYFGNGDGTFGDRVRITDEFEGGDLARAVDIDGDGVDEIAAIDSPAVPQPPNEPRHVFVYELIEPTMFAAEPENYLFANNANGVSQLIADINGDQRPDLISGVDHSLNRIDHEVGAHLTLGVRLATDDGFSEETILGPGPNPAFIDLLLGDFLGRGWDQPALLELGRDGNSALWIVDATDATTRLLSPVSLHEFPVGLSFFATRRQILTTDLNNDGRSDILVLADDHLTSYFSDDSDRWNVASFGLHSADSRGPREVWLIDANGDRFPDVQLSDGRIFANVHGEGSWRRWPLTPSPRGRLSVYADINNDGFIDRIEGEASGGDTEFTVSLSGAEGAYSRPLKAGISPPPDWWRHSRFADIDGDGALDFIVHADRRLRLAFGDGAGRFDEFSEQPLDYPLRSPQFAELNGDGHLDFVAEVLLDRGWVRGQFHGDGQGAFNLVRPQSTTIVRERFVIPRLEPSHAVHVIVSNNTGQPTRYVVPVSWETEFPEAPELHADIDLDGDMDLIFGHADGFVVLRGVGSGDLTRDGTRNGEDVDFLRSFNGSIRGLGVLDLNSDQHIDDDDVTYLVEQLANTRHGDTDFDGDVDFEDLVQFAANFETSDAGWRQGDFDGDGTVSLTDLMLLVANFGFVRVP